MLNYCGLSLGTSIGKPGTFVEEATWRGSHCQTRNI